MHDTSYDVERKPRRLNALRPKPLHIAKSDDPAVKLLRWTESEQCDTTTLDIILVLTITMNVPLRTTKYHILFPEGSQGLKKQALI